MSRLGAAEDSDKHVGCCLLATAACDYSNDDVD